MHIQTQEWKYKSWFYYNGVHVYSSILTSVLASILASTHLADSYGIYLFFFLVRVRVQSQRDVIGQNLADMCHSESAIEITDRLKPSAMPPSSMVEERVISQFRQFYVRLRSTTRSTYTVRSL